MSPIELFFASLKNGNINPDQLPLGKSKYIFLFLILVESLHNVVKLVHGRVATIRKSHIVMYFHHAVLELFKYLDNKVL